MGLPQIHIQNLVIGILLSFSSQAFCGTSSNSSQVRRSPADIAADKAKEQIGKPYKYGGSSPVGFDCSGLVQYSYRRAGVKLPRRSGDQRLVAAPIERHHLRKGDLVFFNEEGKRSSHVGIYLGHGRFVHAPSTGGKVNVARINSAHWARHFAEARRIVVDRKLALRHNSKIRRLPASKKTTAASG